MRKYNQMLEENYWMTVYNKLDLIIRFTGDNEWRRKTKRKEETIGDKI